jgi:regulator of protease activity HflC (stomatin/prohibitin superfamily)
MRDEHRAMPSFSSARRVAIAVAVGLAALVVLVFGAGGFKSVPPGDICVVQEGGPLDGRGVKDVRQPSTGVAFIGTFNSQRCFPATERNYVLSADPQTTDAEAVDFFETPSSDAVQVRIEGQALFRLSTNEKVVEQFYRRFGVRTFNGLHPYDGNEGWTAFLNVQFRPILENALREAIGQYRCVELNNTCAYVQDPNAAARGVDEAADNVQNLAEVQTKIAETFQKDLTDTLGGPFFEGIRFRLVQVRFDPELQKSIVRATAARADVATKRLEAQQKVETAIGDRRVAEQKARAIRATRNAYRDNPAQARIDGIRALPQNLQALGGNLNSIVGGTPGR